MACKFWAKYAGMSANTTIRKHWMNLLCPETDQEADGSDDLSSCVRWARSELRFERWRVAAGWRRGAGQPAQHSCGRLRARCPRLPSRAGLRHVQTTARGTQRIQSDFWPEKGAAILALAAFTQGTETPDAMRDSYSIVVPRILNCYVDQNPFCAPPHAWRCRSSSGAGCVAWKTRGQGYLPWHCEGDSRLQRRSKQNRHTLAVRLSRLRDAAQAALQDSPMVSAVTRLNWSTRWYVQITITRWTPIRDACTSTACLTWWDEPATHMTNNDMRLLMPPLLDAWKSQTWDPTVQWMRKKNCFVSWSWSWNCSDQRDSPEGIIATYGKSTLYAPFAECVFEKPCTDINGCVFTREISYNFSAS